MRRIKIFGLAALGICLAALAAPNLSAATTPTVIDGAHGGRRNEDRRPAGLRAQRRVGTARSAVPAPTGVLPDHRAAGHHHRSDVGTYLYLVQGGNRALRYGIGVGRDGFQWKGLVKIARKQEWPDWRPPPEMIERQPYLPRFMAGGPGNPLGARAMYLGATVYRIHGTNQPETIGSKVSSGCFRLINPDVIDLYDRVPVGTRVIVRQAPSVEG